ncbi:helix-turn-helix transcriptional regulator [Kribbella deserti]|uniref:LuxR C-terminal-related transcriptional regulator n=1 Tax=Kribbella deserti TaxID=1926257 RepID=A0ABV6QZS9_9ACTN
MKVTRGMFALGEPGGRPVRVVIVAPNPVIRAGVATLIGREPALQIAATVADESGLGSLVVRPDVLLVDTVLREGVVALALGRAEARIPKVPIVALVTGEVPAVADLRAYALAEVDAIVSTTDDIGTAVLAVCSGGADGGWVSPALGAALLRDGNWLATPAKAVDHGPHPSARRPVCGQVTASERAVLLLVADGYTDREIAGRLRRSERVVKYHVSNLLTKFQAKNRAHAVYLAIRTGLLAADCAVGQGLNGQGKLVHSTRDGN